MTEAEKERAAVVAWLENRALDLEEPERSEWPKWRYFLWALFNRFKFGQEHGRLFALSNAASAIERGDHLKDSAYD